MAWGPPSRLHIWPGRTTRESNLKTTLTSKVFNIQTQHPVPIPKLHAHFAVWNAPSPSLRLDNVLFVPALLSSPKSLWGFKANSAVSNCRKYKRNIFAHKIQWWNTTSQGALGRGLPRAWVFLACHPAGCCACGLSDKLILHSACSFSQQVVLAPGSLTSKVSTESLMSPSRITLQWLTAERWLMHCAVF